MKIWTQAIDNSTALQLTTTRSTFNTNCRMSSKRPRKNKVLNWNTWNKLGCSLATNKENSELIRNKTDTVDDNSESHSLVRDTPGCCLHQGVSSEMTLQLALLPHKRLNFGHESLHHIWPLLPAPLNQSVQELFKEIEGGIVVAFNNYLATETPDALTQIWPSANGREKTTSELLS